MLGAVREAGCALKYASNNLPNDREVKQDGYALKFAVKHFGSC